jgi:Tat protein translocase TatB subunit
MFDVSFPELVLVTVIGLLVLGPQRLPKVAAEIGKWVGRARRTATQLRRQLEREIELSEIEKPPPPPPSPPPPPGTPQTTGEAPPVAAQPSGEVPPGPGTHRDQPEIGESAPPPAPEAAEERAKQTPP